MKYFMLLVTFLLAACGGGGSDNSTPSVQSEVADTRFELPPVTAPQCVDYAPDMIQLPQSQWPMCLMVGNVKEQPVVAIIGLAAVQNLYYPANLGNVVPQLESAGYAIVTLDMPCHGADGLNVPVAPPNSGESPNLLCIAQRIAAGDQDIFLRFCSQLSDALDALGVGQAAILGVSRGGYAAITCAAYETRFYAVVLEAPVTDLNYLAEFKTEPVNESLFNTDQYVPYLSNRPVLVRIGAHDDRVGTWKAERFAEEVGATLQVLDCVGHCSPETGQAVAFLEDHPQ